MYNDNFVHSLFDQRNEFQKQTKHYSFISLIKEICNIHLHYMRQTYMYTKNQTKRTLMHQTIHSMYSHEPFKQFLELGVISPIIP